MNESVDTAALPGSEELEFRLAQAEAELFLLREHLRAVQRRSEDYQRGVGLVLESLPVGLLWCGEDGQVRSLNRAAEELLGLSRVDACGQPYRALFPERPSPLDRLRTGEVRGLAHQQGESEDARMLDSTVLEVRDVQGMMLGAVELWSGRTEAARLGRELEDARAYAALGRMAAVAAHEIRNPLGGVSGFLDLLERGFEAGDRRLQHVARMREGLQRLDRLVGEFLEFTRPVECDCMPCEPRALLEAAASDVGALACRLGVRVSLRTDPEARPGSALLDGPRVTAALSNLARNALEASPAGGEVSLSLEWNEDGLIFTVEDEGAGVPENLRDRMFEPFVTGKARGTGLGLSLARRTARWHGGELTFESRQPRGSRFLLALPPQGRTAA